MKKSIFLLSLSFVVLLLAGCSSSTRMPYTNINCKIVCDSNGFCAQRCGGPSVVR